jgi:NhaA family Na+:H+ antiporter
MLVPALLYLAIAPEQWRGAWGIPLSADTAFVVALIVALGSRVPVELRIFLTAAMVVDDVIAVTVVAVFYSGALHIEAMALALLVTGILAFLSCYCKVKAVMPYAILGLALWVLVHESGLHATLTGIVLAFCIPASGEDNPADRLLEHAGARSAYVVLPLFALANAGVTLSPALLQGREGLALAIGAGLMLGKPLGIVGACYLALRCHLATKAEAITWHHIIGAGALSGVGFTMSLFIAGQTLSGHDLEAAKLAILIASLGSATLGFLILRAHPIPKG